MTDKRLLLFINDFSDYNDDKIIFLIPDVYESKATLGFIMTKLIKDQINHRDHITNKTHFFYISNEDVQTGLYNGEILDTTLYPLNGIYKVYRILADTDGNLYLQWARNINADAYIPPYECAEDILTEINNS
jgi:hypothetical protein